MKRLIEFLETDETMLRAAMLGMLIYAVHNSIIIFTIEHMPFMVKLPFSIVAAIITEFIALVLFVKGKKWFGRVYATCLFGLGNFYYWYFMEEPKQYSLVVVSWVFNTIHYAAALYLSEIFYDRRLEKKHVVRQEPIQREEAIDAHVKPLTNISTPVKVAPHRTISGDESVEKRFNCELCNERFSRKFTLERHMANIHGREGNTDKELELQNAI